ncbi:MAG: ComEC/Rec2 family competence protein [Actinobacteria bacterium]|nr:ComEC/Rec2 family competence protein [Actinomycetota bacterium]
MRRLIAAAGAAWAASAVTLLAVPALPWAAWPLPPALALIAWAAVLLAARRGLQADHADALVLVVVVLLAAGAASWRLLPLVDGPLVAAQGSFVRAEAVTTSDPRVREGRTTGSRRTDDGLVLEADLLRVVIAGAAIDLDLPVRVITGGGSGLDPALLPGSRIAVSGRLLPADPRRRLAATLVAERVALVAPAGAVQSAAGEVRLSLRAAVADRPPDARGLLPGLVVGDTSQVAADLDAAMKASGLAHLTAVSGGNVAIVAGVVVVLARLVGLRRGRTRIVVVALTVAAYVVVARPEPSVVRAAAMTGLVLLASSFDVRAGPGAALATSVAGLVMLDPFLSLSVGFAMSVLATAALVVVAVRAGPGLQAGPWHARLRRAVVAACGVSAAAQLAVAPLIAGIGGGVPLVGVPANLLTAPAVAPATSLGLISAVVGLISPSLAAAVALPASWCVGWIAAVARWTAAPGLSLPWPSGAVGAVQLAAALLVGGAAWALARRHLAPVARLVLAAAGCACLVAAALPVRIPFVTAWPPDGWVMVMCDVGQGDALVLRAGDGEAVVVDTGPEPDKADRCLRRLGIRSVPLVLLTHFHADHVEGLPGVLRGRSVGTVVTSPLDDPPGEGRRVGRWTTDAGVPTRVAAPGDTWTVGDVRLDVVWPTRILAGVPSPPNDASVTVVGSVGGTTFVLGGDLETEAQDALLAERAFGPVDVVKVPHHGSRSQSPDWAATFRPRFALIGVGVGNEYGHPAPATVDAYRAAGAAVGRTDLDGDLAVVRHDDGTLELLRRGP